MIMTLPCPIPFFSLIASGARLPPQNYHTTAVGGRGGSVCVTCFRSLSLSTRVISFAEKLRRHTIGTALASPTVHLLRYLAAVSFLGGVPFSEKFGLQGVLWGRRCRWPENGIHFRVSDMVATCSCESIFAWIFVMKEGTPVRYFDVKGIWAQEQCRHQNDLNVHRLLRESSKLLRKLTSNTCIVCFFVLSFRVFSFLRRTF